MTRAAHCCEGQVGQKQTAWRSRAALVPTHAWPRNGALAALDGRVRQGEPVSLRRALCVSVRVRARVPYPMVQFVPHSSPSATLPSKLCCTAVPFTDTAAAWQSAVGGEQPAAAALQRVQEKLPATALYLRRSTRARRRRRRR